MFKFDKLASSLPSDSELEVLATSRDTCSVCPDAPPINFEERAGEKEPLTVYGISGSYQVPLILLHCLMDAAGAAQAEEVQQEGLQGLLHVQLHGPAWSGEKVL